MSDITGLAKGFTKGATKGVMGTVKGTAGLTKGITKGAVKGTVGLTKLTTKGVTKGVTGATKVAAKGVTGATKVTTKGVGATMKGATKITTLGVKGVTTGVSGVTKGVTYGVKGVTNVATVGVKGVTNVATTGVTAGLKGVATGVSGVAKGATYGVTGTLNVFKGSKATESGELLTTEDGVPLSPGALGGRYNYKFFDLPSQGDEPSSPGSLADHSRTSGSFMSGNFKASHIVKSAGTMRLNRILKANNVHERNAFDFFGDMEDPMHKTATMERLDDADDMAEVGRFVGQVVLPPLHVDSRSIGGYLLEGNAYPASMHQETLVCCKCASFEFTGSTEGVSMSALQYPSNYAKHKRSLGLFGMGSKGRSKVNFVLIARSTNRPLVMSARGRRKSLIETSVEEGVEDYVEGYDHLYAPSNDEGVLDEDDMVGGNAAAEEKKEATNKPVVEDTANPLIVTQQQEEQEEPEVSSFPVLVCMSMHNDGTNPSIRKLIELDQLTTLQDLTGSVVQLAFNGETVRLDFGESDDEEEELQATLEKERFIWSLLQIHAMLCVSVVERNSMGNAMAKDRVLLPPINVRNIDRAELQYVATVNGFLKKSKAICALLDRQRSLAGTSANTTEEQKISETEQMDGMAYDLMMGNYAMRVAIFNSADERADAEAILNAQEYTYDLTTDDAAAASAAERLSLMLQRRMRDLEAETCRRLIAWEDEKYYSLTGQASLFSQTVERDTVDALSLASLFTTLDALDKELQTMEEWLQERAAAIKPLTDDCRDIEEENRQLEQQWKSYDMLGAEMRRILKPLKIKADLERILTNPASILVYDDVGKIDVDASERGVDYIYDAGKALYDALEHSKQAGALHLRAVSDRVQTLAKKTEHFCTQLAQIIVTVMEQYQAEVVANSDHGKVSKSDTHSMIAKKIRDTQRSFQSALLGYIRLIEILALLSPTLLPAVRDSYSEMVAEGILMKKRMKGYFQALPGRNSAFLTPAAKDLKEYPPFESTDMQTVHVEDIRAALSELLPVIAREAYFTAALFGLSNKAQDGREKKRNFEAAKTSVDHSAQYFQYYIQRTCGIAHEIDADASNPNPVRVRGDPMLSLVASICLNEQMENYIDREKKGGDHSLSLAYVRATILDLRKRVDKQWVAWVDTQIGWIKTNPGVPFNGKRAGVIASFARFPSYLDHILQCCREGQIDGYTPDFANIKVVSYYLQKMATALLESLRTFAERETTDQQYASNVLQMENTYYFAQSIKKRGPEMADLFAKQVNKANAICKQSTDAYLGWMIKREFTTLHGLFSNISKVRKEFGDKEVAFHVPKSTFVKTLTRESNRDVMKEKIAIMYARMQKHLSAEGGLLPVAWKALVKVLYEWFGRWEKLSSQCYRHMLEPSAVDVVRIAKAAGGGGANPTNPSSNGENGGGSVDESSDSRPTLGPSTKGKRRSLLNLGGKL